MLPSLQHAAGLAGKRAKPVFKGLAGVALAMLLFALSACDWPSSKPPSDLPNDAYVWQRRWTPPVRDALLASAEAVRAWRVLAAEKSAGGKWIDAQPDLHAVALSKRSTMMVLRLDGRVDALNVEETVARIAALQLAWRKDGVTLTGVEIDYDCATSKLAAYRDFLTALKKRLEPGTLLSITTLPTWLNSGELDALLRVPDEAVLQLHAVQNPTLGLFDAKRALAWTTAFSNRTQRPWRVALPTYGSRVSWDDDGNISAIESERPALLSANRASELVAAPATMAAFADQLRQQAPAGLAGIVWFRLPTAADERAWSLATWRAVLMRQTLNAGLQVTAQPAGGAGALDLKLSNNGNADTTLPFAIRWNGVCRAADGINGYTLERDDAGWYLRRRHDGLLRAGALRNIGWIRCESPPTTFHVQP